MNSRAAVVSGSRPLEPAYEAEAEARCSGSSRTVSSYPDAANAVPYELYDDITARTKVQNAEEVIAWLRSRIQS